MDASSVEGVKEQQKIAEFLQEMKTGDMNKVLFTPEGRRVLWNIIVFCRVFEGNFYGNSRDMFERGIQMVGKTLLKDVMEVKGFSILDLMKKEFEEQVQLARLSGKKK